MQFNAGKFAGVVFWAFCAGFIFLSIPGLASAQSTDIEFPTALTENQINGVIKARDVGDPRVTTFYYTFNGLQGDLFVNVVTKNLSGSVDVFLFDGMRPLSNIIVYADVVQSETGRVIYLRKPEKLILRVQGRTPNDDPAEFQIKFAGGFEAAAPTKEEPPVPKVTGVGENNSGIRVNSVGTIVAVTPKPKPTPRATPVEIAKAEQKNEAAKPSEEKQPNENQTNEAKVQDRPAEDVEGNTAEKKVAETTTAAPVATTPVKTSAKAKSTNRKTVKPKADQSAATDPSSTTKETVTSVDPETKASTEEAAKETKPEVVVADTTAKADAAPKIEVPAKKVNPLANVRLVILLKDGTKVERPMTEVLRFTADQSTLTVVGTNGRVSKFPILDVASVTIQ